MQRRQRYRDKRDFMALQKNFKRRLQYVFSAPELIVISAVADIHTVNSSIGATAEACAADRMRCFEGGKIDRLQLCTTKLSGVLLAVNFVVVDVVSRILTRHFRSQPQVDHG